MAIIATGVLFVFFKLNGTQIEQTLWAEDGNIFINQAREFGLSSIWMPYAGYFHLYPRLIAWLSCLFDLQTTPLIFFSGWFFAYVALIYVAANKVLQLGANSLEAGLLVILMLAQPHSGEVFFTLTNAQWLMGGALAIYLLVPVKDGLSIWGKGTLLLACLTGPFSLVLSPILLMQIAIYRDWKDRKYIYALVGIGALIQLVGILLSNRLAGGGFDKDLSLCIATLFNFMSFGSTSVIAKAAAILFWSTIIIGFVLNSDKKLNHRYNSTGFILLSLLAGVVFFYGAGLLAGNSKTQLLNPLGGGARYFFIPYLLVFFAAWLIVSKQLKLKFLIWAALTMLAVSSFKMFNRDDLQFKAYAEFAKNKGDVLIPIHPQWEIFPSWFIRLPNKLESPSKKPIVKTLLNIKDASMLNISTYEKDQIPSFQALTQDPQLIFGIGENCNHARYLAVEMDVTRPEAGWTQLFWSKDKEFSERQSLRRYYPEGETLMQFALPKKNVNYLRFDPLERQSQFFIKAIRLYCLGD